MLILTILTVHLSAIEFLPHSSPESKESTPCTIVSDVTLPSGLPHSHKKIKCPKLCPQGSELSHGWREGLPVQVSNMVKVCGCGEDRRAGTADWGSESDRGDCAQWGRGGPCLAAQWWAELKSIEK